MPGPIISRETNPFENPYYLHNEVYLGSLQQQTEKCENKTQPGDHYCGDIGTGTKDKNNNQAEYPVSIFTRLKNLFKFFFTQTPA